MILLLLVIEVSLITVLPATIKLLTLDLAIDDSGGLEVVTSFSHFGR